MKAGYSAALRRRVQRLDPKARLYADAILTKAEDIRLRRPEWDAATTKTNIETFDDGAVRLTGTPGGTASHTTSDSYGTDLNEARPLDILAWELDAAIGGDPRLAKVEVFLNRRFNGGQPAFDGDFLLQLYRVPRYGLITADPTFDAWQPSPCTDPIRVTAAAMATDTALVAFALDGLKGRPPGLVVGTDFTPRLFDNTEIALHGGEITQNTALTRINGRLLVAVVFAVGGTNTNYGIGRDSGVATDKASGGTLRHRIAMEPGPAGGPYAYIRNWWKISNTAIGMTRATLSLAGYAATGTIQFTGAHVADPVSGKMDFEQSVQGTVEFRVRGETPVGTTLIASARVGGADGWVPVKDGQAPADVGLAVSPFYEMKADFTSPASLDVTPTLRELGIQDRVTFILADPKTDLVTFRGFEQRVDILSGESLAAEGHVVIQRTGVRDYRDLATSLVAENNFADIEVRVYVGHEDLARSDWLHLDTFRVDDFDPRPTEIDFTCVSVLERLMGTYPLPTGQLFGYFLKAATSDLTAGTDTADFNRELSETAENAGTIVVSVAASATEQSRGVSRAGVPNMGHWATGNWTVKVNVTVANTNIQLSVAVAIINAVGTQQQISAFTDEQQASAGVKIFTLNAAPGDAWAAGAASDRIKLVYKFRNTVASVQSVTIETGTVNTEVIAPWTGTATVQPVAYNNVSIQAAYEDWRDVRIGLAERYRGASPASTDQIFLQGLADVDGKRQLERFAFVAGGWICASQGRVKFVEGYRPSAAVLLAFPMEEIKPGSVSPGLRSRVPDYTVQFGFDNGVRPNDFAGQIQFIHQAALTKFGSSRIDNPSRRLEKDTARMIPDVYLATQIGEPLVQALGAGKFLWPFTSLVPHPELEIGDPVALETDSFAMLDPTTGDQIRGPVWAIGRIAEIEDLWGTGLTVWVRGFASLWALSRSVYRRALFEPPVVEATVFSLANQPQNATVRLRAFPDTATIKYYLHADGTAAPDRDSALWTVYGGAPFTVARSAVADLLLSYFAIDNGIYGDLRTIRIAPDQTAALTNLNGSQAGSSPTITVTVTATPNANVRRIRWYARVGSWPTTDGSQGAALSQTYFISDKSIYQNGGGFDVAGAPVNGGVTEASDSLAAGQHMMWIAVPLDYNGNPGPRFEYDYTESATSITVKPISLALNAAGTDCGGNKRKLDFSWTPNANVVDGTHDLLVYKTQDGWRALLFTEVNPKSVSTKTAVAVNAMANGADPSREDTYDFELKAGSTIIESGSVGSDIYNGHLCLF